MLKFAVIRADVAGVVPATVAALMQRMLQAMFVTKIKIATTIMLMALTGSGVCLANLPEKDAENQDATKPPEMFPDGLEHDFGKVKLGTIVTHAFRIVNTTGVPLRILSLRKS